ncbi:MAG: hypothetical protein JNN02_10295 [Tabrizicola sp.]|nr:hypothetical protein [Tabrizicola sp.]
MTGFDIEVADEIARRIGVRLAVLPNPDCLNHTWAKQTMARGTMPMMPSSAAFP